MWVKTEYQFDNKKVELALQRCWTRDITPVSEIRLKRCDQ